MKNIFLIICLFFSVLTSFATSTEASKYAEEQYSKQIGNDKVHINVKKEHTVEYTQKIGDKIIPAITYGYGDMKTNKCRKVRVSYICLLDENCKPIWSYVVPSK